MFKLLIMKRLIFLLIFIPLVSFGQAVVVIDGKTSENLVQNSIDDWNSEGKFYIGNGKYRIVTVAKSSAISIKKLRKRAIKDINAFTNTRNLNYKIIEETVRERRYGKRLGIITIIIETYNQNGTLALNEIDIEREKDAAKKELISLKEYLGFHPVVFSNFDVSGICKVISAGLNNSGFMLDLI